MQRGGRRLLSFSCNDHLGLSRHPAVEAAAKAAIDEYGVGAGASRLVTGDHPLFAELEERLASLKGYEAACVFGSGYLANAGILPTFVGPKALVLVDELAHACIWAGAKLSGAVVVAFRHNDAHDVEEKLGSLRSRAERVLVATDGVFSMDGDVAPLGEISRICRAHDAWLLVDDAHGLGVVGEGRGAAALFARAHVDLAMGTLSKAAGGYGAYLCASRAVIDLVKTRARTLVYTTGLPPANAAAALAALEIMSSEPERVAAPLDRARRFTQALGLPEAQSAVVPIVLGEAERALAAAADLEAQGLLAVAIRPPTVPPGTARLRCAFSALHTDEHVDALAEAVAHGWRHDAARPLRGRRAHRDRQDPCGCALIRTALQEGWTVDALKPVVSGYEPDRLAESDPGRLLEALGLPLQEPALEALSPWRFSAPVAPPMAAAMEGRPLALAEVVEFCRGRIETTPADFTLVERGGRADVADHRRRHLPRSARSARLLERARGRKLSRIRKPHADGARGDACARRLPGSCPDQRVRGSACARLHPDGGPGRRTRRPDAGHSSFAGAWLRLGRIGAVGRVRMKV